MLYQYHGIYYAHYKILCRSLLLSWTVWGEALQHQWQWLCRALRISWMNGHRAAHSGEAICILSPCLLARWLSYCRHIQCSLQFRTVQHLCLFNQPAVVMWIQGEHRRESIYGALQIEECDGCWACKGSSDSWPSIKQAGRQAGARVSPVSLRESTEQSAREGNKFANIQGST